MQTRRTAKLGILYFKPGAAAAGRCVWCKYDILYIIQDCVTVAGTLQVTNEKLTVRVSKRHVIIPREHRNAEIHKTQTNNYESYILYCNL